MKKTISSQRELSLVLIFCAINSIAAFLLDQPRLLSTKISRPDVHKMYSTNVANKVDLNYVLVSALKKPSKTLAVGIDYKPENTEISSSDLSILSMQLRKIKAAALWTSDWNAAKEFVEEQESARGSFPEPCPVIYFDNNDEFLSEDVLTKAVDAGVTAVVLSPSQIPSEVLQEYKKQVEIIWNIKSINELEGSVVKGAGDGPSLFLVHVNDDDDGNDKEVDSILDAIPNGSVVIASMDAMQEENSEVARGKALKSQGVTSILLRQACVGDEEDIEYATFAINGLTKKQSSTFNMSGLTGSTNGHFGGVADSSARTWQRQK